MKESSSGEFKIFWGEGIPHWPCQLMLNMYYASLLCSLRSRTSICWIFLFGEPILRLLFLIFPIFFSAWNGIFLSSNHFVLGNDRTNSNFMSLYLEVFTGFLDTMQSAKRYFRSLIFPVYSFIRLFIGFSDLFTGH